MDEPSKTGGHRAERRAGRRQSYVGGMAERLNAPVLTRLHGAIEREYGAQRRTQPEAKAKGEAHG